MSEPRRNRIGCSPWAFAGCGCGLAAMLGILFVFVSLSVIRLRELQDPRRNQAAYAACQGNLRVIRRALGIYRQDHHRLPPSLADLEGRYLAAPARLHCPLEARHPGASYRYTPTPAGPSDPLVTCTNHQEGPVVLLHDGKLRLSDDAFLGRRPTQPRR